LLFFWPAIVKDKSEDGIVTYEADTVTWSRLCNRVYSDDVVVYAPVGSPYDVAHKETKKLLEKLNVNKTLFVFGEDLNQWCAEFLAIK